MNRSDTLFILFLLLNTFQSTKLFTPNDLLNETPKKLFKQFTADLNKKYDRKSPEGKERFNNFQNNIDYVNHRNQNINNYRLTLNKFADLSPEEYRLKLGLVADKKSIRELEKMRPVDYSMSFISKSSKIRSKSLDTEFYHTDWSEYFLPARSQEECGSCWAFSATGTIEAHYAIQYGQQFYLSPQYLMNCVSQNQGCNGGTFANTYMWLLNNGLVRDELFPYTKLPKRCSRVSSRNIITSLYDFEFCSSYSLYMKCTDEIVYEFLQRGPVNVGIDANSPDFMNYESGIFTYDKCEESNHAVTLVGYGRDAYTDLEYWLIRNSWGTSWGENGYMRVKRDAANHNSCFITDEAFLPIIY
jgi:cathepsin L